MPRPLLCPICKSAVQELDRTGDATGFDCETHGKFKIANKVFKEGRVKNYIREQWEAALRKAKKTFVSSPRVVRRGGSRSTLQSSKVTALYNGPLRRLRSSAGFSMQTIAAKAPHDD